MEDFSDDFHPDLQHNREGVFSFAKSSDDTNNSQFFGIEVPTRFLDFNHSIFGQLVEGFDVREAISETSTPESRGVSLSQKPDIDVTIETIEVFDDIENSVVMLKALGDKDPWVRFMAYRSIKFVLGKDKPADWIYGSDEARARAVAQYAAWVKEAGK